MERPCIPEEPRASVVERLFREYNEALIRFLRGRVGSHNGALEVRPSENLRAVEHTKGEALFKVAKDPARPFKVRAGDATIIAVGTEFNVERDSDRAVVSVTEGRVVVKPVDGLLPVSLLGQEPGTCVRSSCH
jgi:hypothetical protein